jgi:transposase
VNEEFPRILNEARSRNAHLAFVDETGFMLTPLVRRTYAPRGKTPVNRVADPHARILGVHETSVHRWRRMARRPHGLDARPVPGPTPGLSDYHLRKLERLLRQGAHKHGWPNQLWTAARVARLIRDRFGICYHPEHVRKILKQRLGWTSQKPRRKARERNDKEVERWLGDELPRILREAYRR